MVARTTHQGCTPPCAFSLAVGVGIMSASSMSWVPTPWTALHQWTPLAANITLVRRPGDTAENVTARWRILHVTDVHISLGEAVDLHTSGTKRMHNAFRSVVDRHLEPGSRRSPIETFHRLLDLASREHADAIILTGDIVNFPHNASIQQVLRAIVAQRSAEGHRIPTLYTAGNHDWLVEGHAKARKEQRSQFRREFLRPLYAANERRANAQHPPRSSWADAEDVGVLELLPRFGQNGVHNRHDSRLLLLTLDNSHLEVSSAQADFVWRELARGLPTLLAVHVPFMLPDSTPKNSKDVLCGDPRYNHDGDTSWQVERRERWPRGGAPASTSRFIEDLVRWFAAPRGPLLGVLGGHQHVHRVDTIGTTQVVPPLKLTCESSGRNIGGMEEPPRCYHKQHGHRQGLPLHEGLAQYVTLPGCEGGHRLVEVRDARYST